MVEDHIEYQLQHGGQRACPPSPLTLSSATLSDVDVVLLTCGINVVEVSACTWDVVLSTCGLVFVEDRTLTIILVHTMLTQRTSDLSPS